MEEFLQQVVNGLSIAGVITLIAIGITLIFGLTGIVMFAQGELLMLGGLITFSTVAAGGSFYLGLLFAVLAMGVLGLLLERGLFRFTLRAPMNGFIVSLGLIVALQHIAVEIWSGDQRIIAKPIETVWQVGDIRISATRVLVIAVTVALVVAIHYGMSRTRYGRALRATAAESRHRRANGRSRPAIHHSGLSLGEHHRGTRRRFVDRPLSGEPLRGGHFRD